jgi:DNA-binding transcriptional LysR family regulator
VVDTELLKTFLEVNRTRHFGKAAENLFVTQSAVSARIRQLEAQLGAQLFTRDRNNIQPTQRGAKLVAYAESILGVWTRARAEIALDDTKRGLSVGAVPGVLDVFLPRWLGQVHAHIPDVVLTADALDSVQLRRRILEHTLDLGFVFDAPGDPDLAGDEYFRIPLILVASAAGLTLEQATTERYVFVDWGTRATVIHAQHFPDLPTPILRTGLGRVARDFILANGGAAYLPRTMVAADLDRGRLHEVASAPVLSRTIHAVYRLSNPSREILEQALAVDISGDL